MEKSVVDTKSIIVNNINSLFNELEQFSKELDSKYKNMNEMKEDIDQKHQDINSFKKVSFIANMNKQLENKNKLIIILERRITSLQNKNDKLTQKLKEFDSELIIESDEDSVISTNLKDDNTNIKEANANLDEEDKRQNLEADKRQNLEADKRQNLEADPDLDDDDQKEDIWLIKEFDGDKYLYNSETRKVHIMKKNECPGDIIGRITSKDKFKKYNQPKEYC
jgi:chromosome segregation ATPase